MRGKDPSEGAIGHFFGITPAYAGKSELVAVLAFYREDHPRICGEKV